MWGNMTMKIKAVCCELCVERIALTSPTAARIWMDLCDSHANIEHISINLLLREHTVPPCIPALKTLEELRFIDTCDGFEAIQIRVKGFKWEDNKYTYCLDRTGHEDVLE